MNWNKDCAMVASRVFQRLAEERLEYDEKIVLKFISNSITGYIPVSIQLLDHIRSRTERINPVREIIAAELMRLTLSRTGYGEGACSRCTVDAPCSLHKSAHERGSGFAAETVNPETKHFVTKGGIAVCNSVTITKHVKKTVSDVQKMLNFDKKVRA